MSIIRSLVAAFVVVLGLTAAASAHTCRDGKFVYWTGVVGGPSYQAAEAECDRRGGTAFRSFNNGRYTLRGEVSLAPGVCSEGPIVYPLHEGGRQVNSGNRVYCGPAVARTRTHHPRPRVAQAPRPRPAAVRPAQEALPTPACAEALVSVAQARAAAANVCRR